MPLVVIVLSTALPSVAVAAWMGGIAGAVVGCGISAVVAGLWVIASRREAAEEIRAREAADAASSAPELRPEDRENDPGNVTAFLRRENDRLHVILATIREGVVSFDRHGRATYVNRSARRLLGLQEGRGRGYEVREILAGAQLGDWFESALEGDPGESRREMSSVEDRTIEVDAVPLQGTTRLVLVLRDVTGIRELETMRRDFVANVSHELKTPLTAIKAYVETLLDGGLDDPSVRTRFVRKIDSNADRLTALITDLLTLSRVESGKMVGTPTTVNLSAIVKDCVGSFGRLCAEKSLTLRVDLRRPDLLTLGDAEALHQVFDNLISNAVKYTEAGGSVTVKADETEDRVWVEVVDTGIGIPKSDLPRIFERFYRVDKARSREHGGTGLGLSIVKHYLEALDGEIEVTSKPGEGSTFRVTLPRA